MSSPSNRIDLEIGPIEYTDTGSGPPLLFVHGVFVNGSLWQRVVPELSRRYRCIVPTLPLGGHTLQLRDDADVTPIRLAAAIVELAERLDLHDVTLVGNDTGGALCQLALVRDASRIARVVFTNCDAFESFPPKVLRPLYFAARNAALFSVLARLLRSRAMRRAFYRTVALGEAGDAHLAELLDPFCELAGTRRDLRKLLRAISPRTTLEAARAFATFEGEVVALWGVRDLFFLRDLGRRLANAFPRGTYRSVEGSRTFVPEDRPDVLISTIDGLVGATAVA